MIEVNSTLKKRPPPRFRNMKPKLRRWSAKSVHSRWRLTGLKKRHGDLSIPTASSHPSSAAPWPLHPAGVSNDSTSAQYLLLSRPDASAQLERRTACRADRGYSGRAIGLRLSTHHPCFTSARLECQPQADSPNHEAVRFGN